KFTFPFDKQEIPENGIYILFEQGEFAHSTNRIVRIGTHTGRNQLHSRLFQHFLKENKDRSIFRKNIGRALLNKSNDPFLEKWELDLTTKNAKDQHSGSVDSEKQKEIEKRVTKCIQDNFSFVVFPIDEKDKRLELESNIISTVSLCKECKPSENWLGKFCPNEKLQNKKTHANCLKLSESGLWNVHYLFKENLLLSAEDMIELKQLLNID
ncbi:MAG: hypothetical protein KKA43_06125, partial [Nanoarchaeota archaeon]|nr:hypothetical protein [Nanoarchaeota archaeon]